ncbi:MAG TPA: hypothetical protein PLO61_07145 [Fimbriimonadaceae bacterium]|nr:hypothetical protein [Fimbriimonadaceae bacterium]HRJ33297.1 hypothetical protein [Fimbriimonadaceae bacterium]
MAKANLSVLFLDLRGKAGNVVFRKTKDGIIVAPRSRNNNPQTAAQQAVRSAFTSATRQWRNLTPAQVQAWENWANNSSFNFDSAFTAWMQLATKWILANGGNGFAPTTPPSNEFWGDNLEVSVTVKTGQLVFSANRPNSSNVVTEILWQPLSSQNRKPQSRAFRTANYFSFRTGQMSWSFSVPAGWYAAGYRFVNKTTGQVSGFFPITVPGPVAFSVTTPSNNSNSTSSTTRRNNKARTTSRKSSTKRTATRATSTKQTATWKNNTSNTSTTSNSSNNSNSNSTVNKFTKTNRKSSTSSNSTPSNSTRSTKSVKTTSNPTSKTSTSTKTSNFKKKAA